jgi:hypothetical protein
MFDNHKLLNATELLRYACGQVSILIYQPHSPPALLAYCPIVSGAPGFVTGFARKTIDFYTNARILN